MVKNFLKLLKTNDLNYFDPIIDVLSPPGIKKTRNIP